MVSLMVWNTYLVPYWTARFQRFPEQYFSHTLEARASSIARLAKQYDIVALQEVWGVQLGTLHQQLDRPCFPAPSKWIPKSGNAHYHRFFQEWWHPLRGWWNREGGLFISTSLSVLFTKQSPFAVSATRSGKGIQASFMQVPHNRHLLLLNTHLDTVQHPEQQKYQLQQISAFLRDLVHEKLIYDAYKSSRMSVVLFGDFNCKSSDRKAYEMLLKLGDCSDRSVTMRDLSKSEEPTYDTVNNELAEDKEAHGRIDYVFSIERLQTPSEVFEFVPVEAHWLAQGHRGYENCCKDIDIDYSISDHYPNIVRLEWNSKVQ